MQMEFAVVRHVEQLAEEFADLPLSTVVGAVTERIERAGGVEVIEAADPTVLAEVVEAARCDLIRERHEQAYTV